MCKTTAGHMVDRHQIVFRLPSFRPGPVLVLASPFNRLRFRLTFVGLWLEEVAFIRLGLLHDETSESRLTLKRRRRIVSATDVFSPTRM